MANTNFLAKTFLSSEELAILAILKVKSKDKYSDKDLTFKTNILFEKLEDSLKNSIYQNLSCESIEEYKSEIIQIKNAIKNQSQIKCTYKEENRILIPLKILNFDGFWYLINHDYKHGEKRFYHLNSIKNVELLDNKTELDKIKDSSFDNAINAYFDPDGTPFSVKLFLDKEVSKYFLRKPINKTQVILEKYDNGDCDIEIFITNFMEVIPIIQRFLPHILVISPNELGDKIKENLDDYFNKI